MCGGYDLWIIRRRLLVKMPPAVTVLPGWLPRAAGASILLLLASLAVLVPAPAHAIGCFVCSSVNGSNPDCEDTFNNTGRFYQSECKAGRKQRSGLFPGTECIKMKAEREDGSAPFTIIVRQCVVDSGGTNSETEIGRSNHCGLVNELRFNDDPEKMKGCIVSCRTDGCNSAPHSRVASLHVTLLVAGLVMVITSGQYAPGT